MTQSTPPNPNPNQHSSKEKSKGTVTDGLGDDAANIGRGQYGVAEEPQEFKDVNLSQGPKDPDEKFRDAARDKEVKETGEDLP